MGLEVKINGKLWYIRVENIEEGWKQSHILRALTLKEAFLKYMGDDIAECQKFYEKMYRAMVGESGVLVHASGKEVYALGSNKKKVQSHLDKKIKELRGVVSCRKKH
jgi:hypothetical protein